MPPAAFFAAQDGIFDTQESWVGNIQKAGPELEKLQSAPQDQQFAGVIKVTQLANFFKTRGLQASKQQQCLTDKTAMETSAAIRGAAVKTYKLTGTPNFVLTGVPPEQLLAWNGLNSHPKAT